ncbi:MAG TPA: hypothetical protein VF097_07585 [Actinomycetota bacterium]
MSQKLIATFAGRESARRAALALERRGIEGSSISLEGAARDSVPIEAGDTRGGDRRLSGDVGARVGVGALIGTVVGGILGLALGLLAFPGAGVWASTIGAAVAGGAVGGIVGGVSGLGTGGAWQRTYAEIREGRVVVSVAHSDPDVVDKAEQTLRELEPDRLERLDDGQRQAS